MKRIIKVRLRRAVSKHKQLLKLRKELSKAFLQVEEIVRGRIKKENLKNFLDTFSS